MDNSFPLLKITPLCDCTLVQRKGAAWVVTLPAYGTTTAVAALLMTSCVSSLQCEEALISSKKPHTNQRKGISRLKGKNPRTIENFTHFLTAKHRKHQWECEQLFYSHISSDILAGTFQKIFVQRNFRVCVSVLNNNTNPNFTQHLWIK